MPHPCEQDLTNLTLGTLTTVQSLQIQRHIFHSHKCLKQLYQNDILLMLEDAHPLHDLPESDMRQATRHDTVENAQVLNEILDSWTCDRSSVFAGMTSSSADQSGWGFEWKFQRKP